MRKTIITITVIALIASILGTGLLVLMENTVQPTAVTTISAE